MDHFHIALSDDQLRAVSSIGLAHVGDAVYALVCAPEQARRAQRILPLLTAEEETVFKRGRNAAVHAIPKNATTAQYHQATALECLLGWLYLRGDTARVSDLFDVMMEEN